MKLLLQQQPVGARPAHDLPALKMISDLERIGDQASTSRASPATSRMSSSSRARTSMKWPAPPAAWSRTASIPSSARISATARAVQKEDDIVDGLFDTVKNELVGQITEHPDLSGECLDL